VLGGLLDGCQDQDGRILLNALHDRQSSAA
jgi:hypothetical protein